LLGACSSDDEPSAGNVSSTATATPSDTASASQSPSGDGTSIAVERITQVAAHDRLQDLLDEIDRALAKVDEGTYGRCDTCNNLIGPERLEVRPWSTHCVDHA
jgi:DnaK suppressor protein